jgi:hypothetical protein
MAVLGDHLEQSFMVLFRRIKIGMNKGPAIVIAPAIDGFGIFPAPPFHPAFSFRERDAPLAALWINSGLKMVRHRNHEMHLPAPRCA